MCILSALSTFLLVDTCALQDFGIIIIHFNHLLLKAIFTIQFINIKSSCLNKTISGGKIFIRDQNKSLNKKLDYQPARSTVHFTVNVQHLWLVVGQVDSVDTTLSITGIQQLLAVLGFII